MPDEGGAEDAGRIRDLPAPRRNRSLIGPLFQKVFTWPYRVMLAGLHRAGVRGWHLTVASLLTNVVIGWLLLTHRRLLPGALLLPAGLFDIFDGGVARLRREDSRLGAFLDSTLDRLCDGILFGCLFWSLSGLGADTQAVLALVALGVSLMVSHIRADGEALGLAISEGAVQRLERYVALMVGLMVPGALLPVLIGLVALGGITVLQRTWSALRGLLRAPVSP